MTEVRQAENPGFAILDFMPVGAFILDHEYIVLFWNKCLESWTRIRPHEICGQDIRTRFSHFAEPRYAFRLAAIFQGGPPTIFSAQLHESVIPAQLPNGSMRLQHTIVTAVQTPDSSSFHALFTLQDVTDIHARIRDYVDMRDKVIEELRTRRWAEEALRQAEQKYRSIFENAAEGIFQCAADGHLFDANRAMARIFGYESPEELIEEGLGASGGPFGTADERKELFGRILQREGLHSHEMCLRHKNGHPVWVQLSARTVNDSQGNCLYVAGVLLDCTSRRQMQEELLKAKKLEAASTLAGGVAHDFNNLLSVILGYIELAELAVVDGIQDIPALLSTAKKGCLQAEGLVRKFITLSTGGDPVKCSTSVEEIIEKVAAYSLSGYDIECRFAFEPDIWPVQIDPGQVSQVIRNLMDNCREAMPRGGVITLSAGNVVVVPGTGKPFLPLDEGSYVKITIQDGGLGILQENMGRIFDPYFTTKDRGNKKGMGLGLTIAHSIIRKHGGHIQLSSQPGTGTTVEVYLRRHEGSENKGENGLVGV